ncbi:A24 family peptidase [Pantoea sp.]|uniref:prepilin peptidase n=1 Tax=Pantoea sp. TaxID=69393 RepID=UPI00289D3D5D|nr:A24 family peptidase [Pantoea sp.]
MTTTLLFLFCFAMAGATAGSFLSLASQRYRPELSTSQWLCSLCWPRSHCDDCGHVLCWPDLIPLFSWLALGRRCRYCRSPIAMQTVAFEISGMLVFIINGTFFTSTLALTGATLCGCLLLLLADIDRRFQRLPDSLTYILLWSGLGYSLYQHSLTPSDAILGALLGYLAFWLLAFLYRIFRKREGLGYGDMKLYAALGAWCGWQALPMIAFIAASLAFSLLVVLYVAGKTWKKDNPLPFGPFLAAAGWYVLIMQQPLSLNLRL